MFDFRYVLRGAFENQHENLILDSGSMIFILYIYIFSIEGYKADQILAL